MVNDLVTSIVFEVNVNVNLKSLKENAEFFRSRVDEVILCWMEDEAARKTIEKYIPIAMFISEYAMGIYNYYLNVIDAKVELGDCPTIKRFLDYCSQENVLPHELFLICGGFRKSIISIVSDQSFCSREIIEDIGTVTDQNFAGVMFIYSQILENNRLLIEKKTRLLKEQYLYDELTGLKNVNSLQIDIDNGEPSIFLIADISRLHEINESYGYTAGDMVLLQAADFISSVYEIFQAEIYRVVGDEFGVLIKQSNMNGMDVGQLARLLQNQLLSKYFMVYDDEALPGIPIQVTIGISQTKNLLINTFSALHDAKLNDFQYVVYEKSNSNLQNNISMIQQLHYAIESAKIVAYFQPIVNNKTKEISKYETLVRMLDDNNEPVSPFFFLEASKRARLYPFLTKIVTEQAWNTFYNSSFQFSVNIEREDILNTATREHILSLIDIFNDPSRIIFELVESEMISDDTVVHDFFNTIRSKGCQLAIDDFGSGFSNFEYLLRIKANIIKIDGSLIKDIDTHPEKRAIVKSIVSFAQDIGLETVAEYVSSEKIFNIVRDMGITYSQGYFFGEPMPQIARSID